MNFEPNTITDWLHLVQAEYLEIPGLSLTRVQARRLWGLAPPACDAILDSLVAARFLRETPRGTYVLADGGPALQALAAQHSTSLH